MQTLIYPNNTNDYATRYRSYIHIFEPIDLTFAKLPAPPLPSFQPLTEKYMTSLVDKLKIYDLPNFLKSDQKYRRYRLF